MRLYGAFSRGWSVKAVPQRFRYAPNTRRK